MKGWIFLSILYVTISVNVQGLITKNSTHNPNPSEDKLETAAFNTNKTPEDSEDESVFLEKSLKEVVRSVREIRKHDLGPLLHFIVTKWQRFREQILNPQISQVTLQNFVELAMSLIEDAYSDKSVYDLIFQLRLLWRKKSKDYSSRFSQNVKYINSMYSPSMFEDTVFFNNRLRLELAGSSQEYLPEYYLNRLLEIHVSDSNESHRDDYLSYYHTTIAALEFYFEVNFVECFRVLFAALEVLERNLNSTNATYSNVPEDVAEMLRNNTAYSVYLVDKKREILSLVGEHNETMEFRDRLEENARVSDPDLVMLTWMRIKNLIATSSATSSSSSVVQQSGAEDRTVLAGPSTHCETRDNVDYDRPGPSGLQACSSSQIQPREPERNSLENGTARASTENRNSNTNRSPSGNVQTSVDFEENFGYVFFDSDDDDDNEFEFDFEQFSAIAKAVIASFKGMLA